MIGEDVTFTDPKGRERTGVVRDDKDDGRLRWSSGGRYLVVSPTPLGRLEAFWVDDVAPLAGAGS